MPTSRSLGRIVDRCLAERRARGRRPAPTSSPSCAIRRSARSCCRRPHLRAHGPPRARRERGAARDCPGARARRTGACGTALERQAQPGTCGMMCRSRSPATIAQPRWPAGRRTRRRRAEPRCPDDLRPVARRRLCRGAVTDTARELAADADAGAIRRLVARRLRPEGGAAAFERLRRAARSRPALSSGSFSGRRGAGTRASTGFASLAGQPGATCGRHAERRARPFDFVGPGPVARDNVSLELRTPDGFGTRRSSSIAMLVVSAGGRARAPDRSASCTACARSARAARRTATSWRAARSGQLRAVRRPGPRHGRGGPPARTALLSAGTARPGAGGVQPLRRGASPDAPDAPRVQEYLAALRGCR